MDNCMNTASPRHMQMVTQVLGQELLGYLQDQNIIEIMVNPDGSIWLDTLNQGKIITNHALTAPNRLNIIKLIASLNKRVINQQEPELACEIPFAKARFQAWIHPVAEEPTFTIRKKALKIFSLQDYVAKGSLKAADFDLLQRAVKAKLNILVAGGTGSGKTTFVNALLNELRDSGERIVVLEDLPELQVNCRDVVRLLTSPAKTMRDLVKGTLRMRPDRIVIGEVRDSAAVELLKAWNTGHSGGFITLHANSVDSVKSRLENLILETMPFIPPGLIEEAIDVIVFMQRSAQHGYELGGIKLLSQRAMSL